jgi:nucleotide-binding universal stress UspA family protein
VTVAVADPVDGLLVAASDRRAWMVVLGSRGRGAGAAALLGSVSQSVGAKAATPVVVVPSLAVDATRRGFRSGGPVIYGALGEQERGAAAEWAQAFAEVLDSPLVAAHVGSSAALPPQALTVTQAAHLATIQARVAAPDADDGSAEVERVTAASPAGGLIRLASKRNAAMLVVGSRGRGPIKSALLGSTASQLSAEAPCPVVICPPRARHPGALAAASHRRSRPQDREAHAWGSPR